MEEYNMEEFDMIRNRFLSEETTQDRRYLVEQIYQLAQELECELENKKEYEE